MAHARWLRLAQAEVDRTLERLPDPIREAAAECVVIFEEEEPEEEDLRELLGLFEGSNRLDPPPSTPLEVPRIRLFLPAIAQHSGGDDRLFRREVRITYLHELAHYLGWNEDQVAGLGLA